MCVWTTRAIRSSGSRRCSFVAGLSEAGFSGVTDSGYSEVTQAQRSSFWRVHENALQQFIELVHQLAEMFQRRLDRRRFFHIDTGITQ